MNEAEFDKFADAYDEAHAASIAVFGEEPEYFSEYKIRNIACESGQLALQQKSTVKILDFGAGIGNSVPYVHKYFASAELACLDLSQRSLKIAEKRFPYLAQYIHFDGTHIPFPVEYFDIVFAMCVFHHIDYTDHVLLLQELRRVIRPSGSLFIFEHNPKNPLTVRVVNSCPFDENARLISGSDMKQRLLAAGFTSVKIRYRVFFPHFLRVLRPIEKLLTWLPLGGQYYVLSRK